MIFAPTIYIYIERERDRERLISTPRLRYCKQKMKGRRDVNRLEIQILFSNKNAKQKRIH